MCVYISEVRNTFYALIRCRLNPKTRHIENWFPHAWHLAPLRKDRNLERTRDGVPRLGAMWILAIVNWTSLPPRPLRMVDICHMPVIKDVACGIPTKLVVARRVLSKFMGRDGCFARLMCIACEPSGVKQELGGINTYQYNKQQKLRQTSTFQKRPQKRHVEFFSGAYFLVVLSGENPPRKITIFLEDYWMTPEKKEELQAVPKNCSKKAGSRRCGHEVTFVVGWFLVGDGTWRNVYIYIYIFFFFLKYAIDM